MAIAIGGNSINKAYLGSTEIQKMYLGADLVFDNTSPPDPDPDYKVSATDPDADFATIADLNAATIPAGSVVGFNRGEMFRAISLTVSGGSLGNTTTYTSYGSGNKPLIFGSLDLSLDGNWSDQGSNIWVSTGIATDVGNLIFNDDASVGWKKWSEGDLTTQGDFWYSYSGTEVKMYSVGNPGTFYNNIEASLKANLTNGRFADFSNLDYVTFSNLEFKYVGGPCIWGTGATNINVQDVDMSFIGGAEQNTGNEVRYGNGVVIWKNAQDIIVERCTFDQMYDAALTYQGDDGSVYTGNNVVFRNNKINRSEYSFEIFLRNASTVISNVYFENNVCTNAGGEFTHGQRNPNAAHVMIGNTSAQLSDIHIRNNIFDEATEYSIRYYEFSAPAKYNVDNNCYYQSSGDVARIYGDYYDYATQWEAYQTDSGNDTNSVATNPLLDSNLKPTVTLNTPRLSNVLEDFDSVLRLDPTQQGVYEIGGTPPVDIDYYVSTSGTGSGDGSISDPFVFSQLASADLQDKVVGFNGSDEFYETLTKDYAYSLNATFTSYNGQAIFKGTKTITGFYVHSGSVYVADTVDTIYHVAFGEDLKTNGRLPKIVSDLNVDENYYPITTTVSNTVFISDDMAGIPSLIGANCFIKDYSESLLVRTITGHNTTTGEITINASVTGLGSSDYFFVNNHLSLVTTEGDWYYDISGNKLYIYSDTTVTSIEAITLDNNAFHLEGTNTITIDNIKFLGYNKSAIYAENGGGYNFINCAFKNIQANVISGTLITTALIDNNTFDNCKGVGTYMYGTGIDTTVTNNTVRNTGLLSDLNYLPYSSGTSTGSGLVVFGGNATDNTLTNIGYHGMVFYGGGICERNTISETCLTSHDGGAIYTYDHATYPAVGAIIRNNILSTTVVSSITWSNYGIYCDDNSKDVFLTNNTITGFSSNIYLHNTQRNEVTLNELSLARGSGLLMKNDNFAPDFLDNVIEDNTIAQESDTAMCFRITNNENNNYGLASIDNNTYSNTLSLDCVQLFTTTDSSFNTLEEWRVKSGMDANSTFNSGGSETELLTNPDFTDGSNGWDGTNWTIGGGTADYNGVGYQDILFQEIALTEGNDYKFDADVLSGTVRIRVGGSSYQTYSGTTLIFTNATSSGIYIQATSDTASLNSVSLKDNN